MRLILLGPQGCGKGTQGRMLAQKLNVPHISTGDLLRSLAAEQSPRGKQLAETMNEGKLVDDTFLEQILEERLKRNDCATGFILDGTPRDLKQTHMLDTFIEIDHAIFIDIPRAESIRRVLHRHITEHREDDTREALEKRLATYEEETLPVIEHYKTKNRLISINGMQSVHDVQDEIIEQLGI